MGSVGEVQSSGLSEAQESNQEYAMRKKVFVIVASVALISGLLSGVASAHLKISSILTASTPSPGHCIFVFGELSHGSGGGGYARTETTHQIDDPPAICSISVGVGLTGLEAIRSSFDMYRWDPGLSDWIWCAGALKTAFTSGSNRVTIATNFLSTPPCGSGEYGVNHDGETRFSGTWYHTGFWNNTHWLPA